MSGCVRTGACVRLCQCREMAGFCVRLCQDAPDHVIHADTLGKLAVARARHPGGVPSALWSLRLGRSLPSPGAGAVARNPKALQGGCKLQVVAFLSFAEAGNDVNGICANQTDTTRQAVACGAFCPAPVSG